MSGERLREINAALEAFGTKVVVIEGRGRSLVATRALRAGDVVLCERPFAFVLLQNHTASRCASCFRTLSRKLQCARCKTVAYVGLVFLLCVLLVCARC